MNNIYNYSLAELEEYFINHNQKSYRAEQIFNWLYKKRVNNVADMVNIKKSDLEIIKNNFSFDFIKIIKKQTSKMATKYLIELNDLEKVEAVLLNQNYGYSLCVSSQVGCNMGCSFCESSQVKKIRDLETFEMVQQVLLIEKAENIRISHLVVMGIGEPFDNYDNVMKFIKIINSNQGINIGARHITVSTCGLIPGINRFMDEPLQVNLAISLHAANNKLRNKLMPINRVYNIEKLMTSLKKYYQKTGRRVTFEYIMLAGINDRDQDAQELTSLLKGFNCYVNLIPYNKTNNSQFISSNKVRILQFYDIMKKNKINVTIRKELGADIKAACGQLRAESKEE